MLSDPANSALVEALLRRTNDEKRRNVWSASEKS
jgi:hypothetical protein